VDSGASKPVRVRATMRGSASQPYSPEPLYPARAICQKFVECFVNIRPDDCQIADGTLRATFIASQHRPVIAKRPRK
jgi:hypothetical protein